MASEEFLRRFKGKTSFLSKHGYVSIGESVPVALVSRKGMRPNLLNRTCSVSHLPQLIPSRHVKNKSEGEYSVLKNKSTLKQRPRMLLGSLGARNLSVSFSSDLPIPPPRKSITRLRWP